MYILRSCHLHVFHLHSFTMLRCSLLFRSISIEPRLSSLSVNPFASAGQMGKWCVCEWEVMAEFQRKIVYIAYSLHTKKKHRERLVYMWVICVLIWHIGSIHTPSPPFTWSLFHSPKMLHMFVNETERYPLQHTDIFYPFTLNADTGEWNQFDESINLRMTNARKCNIWTRARVD